MPEYRVSVMKGMYIFMAFTAYFFLLLLTLLSFLKYTVAINPALYWFITGYALFIPLFACAVTLVRFEGNITPKEIMKALYIRPFSKKDWAYSIAGLLLVFAFTGMIFGLSALLNKYCGVRPLSTTPWFMEFKPFQGAEKLLLLVWLPMFFFNIVGEELLWRGYIQSRLPGGHGWALCSLFWMVFHLPFGPDLMIMVVPAIIIIPYVFHKTRNSLTGVFIHGLYNGPVFVLLSLGLLK
jgi:membrane protease YdiL (CAAX protease family)